MIWTATITPGEPLPDGTMDDMIFVSVDGGDTYLPVNRLPEEGDEEAVRALFEGDGNFKPMVWGRRGVQFAAISAKGTVVFDPDPGEKEVA
jgi:hypothetical protein